MSVPESYKELEGLMEDLYEEIATLRAELKTAERRLDFVLNHCAYEVWRNYEGKFYCESNQTEAEDMIGFDTWEQAIDNAIAAKKGEGE
jgi:hypothetical protein